jgi:hypothetical protein
MANVAGIETSYKNTEPMQRSVVDRLNVVGHLTPTLTKLFGGKDGTPALSKMPSLTTPNAVKAEWYNKKLRPSEVTLGANYTSGGTSITLTPASDALYFGKGYILWIDNERFVTTSAGVAGGTIAVAGAKFGTSPANHTSGAKIRVVGRAQGESSDTTTDNFIVGDKEYNYYQGVRVPYSSTWKNQQIARYDTGDSKTGRDAWKTRGEKDAVLEAFRILEEGLLYGLRNEGDGTDDNPATFGGLYQFAQAEDYGGTTLAADNLTDTIYNMWKVGGEMTVPKLALMSGKTRTKISKIYDSTFTKNVNPGDNSVAGVVVDRVHFDFADVDIFPVNGMRDTDIFLLDPSRLYMFPLGELEFTASPVQTAGVRDLMQIYGEYSFVCDLPDSLRRVTNFVLP